MATDPESSSSLNPQDPVDAKLLSLKNSIESDPAWPQRKVEIERENFIGSQTENSGTPADKADVRNAELKARFEAGKGQETANTPSEDGPLDFNQARAKFGEILGVVPGTPEFDGATAEFAAWYDHHSTNPEFDNVVREAERLFGTEEVLRIAHRMAGEHARKRR
jgi:hypothetical protein